MSININIKADVRGVALMLDRAAKKAIPKAERMAVNALAFDVMRAERANAQEVFKNPRPFTAKGFLVKQAVAGGEPSALIYTRPEVEKYLMPYEYGGDHVLPGTALLNPKDITLDGYGQLPKNIMAKLDGMPNIYIGKIKGIMGVWERVNVTAQGNKRRKYRRGAAYHPTLGAIKLLIRFGDALPVTKHLNFETVARGIVTARFMVTFRNALSRAIK